MIAMGLLERLRRRRAAKQYSRRLGPHLRRAYGAAEYYTFPQIRVAVARLGLDAKFIAFGCAAFLSKEAYASATAVTPIEMTYEEARGLLARFRPSSHSGGSNFYESGIGMYGGSDSSGHGGSA
jgi:hypothetical protein